MNLHEYQAKQLFAQHGLPVPQSVLCHSSEQAIRAVSILTTSPWVIKCQVHTGGRGKVGGVKRVNSVQEIEEFAHHWLGKRLVTKQTGSRGQPVNHLLLESVSKVAQELYLGAVVDRSSQRVVFMASTQGGMDIETVAEQTPELIFKTTIDPLTGAQPYQGRELAYQLGLQGKLVNQFTQIFITLSELFIKSDLTLLEINPLAITQQGELLCLDGKISVDNNALFRQPALYAMRDTAQEDPQEAYAEKCGLSYVALEGNIGCLVNGAGLAMATMDIVKLHGGEPANFLDVGGSATKERVAQAFKIILSDPHVNAVLVNIFGGIVRCDLIADGIIGAIAEVGIDIPVVVRLEGNNAQLGAEKLRASGLSIISATDLTDAAQQVVAVAGRR